MAEARGAARQRQCRSRVPRAPARRARTATRRAAAVAVQRRRAAPRAWWAAAAAMGTARRAGGAHGTAGRPWPRRRRRRRRRRQQSPVERRRLEQRDLLEPALQPGDVVGQGAAEPHGLGGQHDEEADLILDELCSLMAQRANKVKKLVSYLSTAVRKRDYDFISTFITIYSRYTTTWQLLNWIMQTYGPFEEQNEEDQLEKNAIIYFLDRWIERCPEEFYRNLDLPKLNHLMEYVKLHMPSSHLLICVEELMTKMEEQESKATPKEEEVADLEPSSAPASASDHQGELGPQEDAVLPKIVQPTILVAQPTPLLQAVSEEDVPTAADAQPPPDVAADAPSLRQTFLSILATLGNMDHLSSFYLPSTYF